MTLYLSVHFCDFYYLLGSLCDQISSSVPYLRMLVAYALRECEDQISYPYKASVEVIICLF
jgi:hypothetical protein